MKNTIKVAGVTFSNDNGVNRQKIIAVLGAGWKTAKLKQMMFNGERAVEVRIDGLLVGYVPKTQLKNPMSNERELTAFIECYNKKGVNKWYVTLSERETPSGKEYAYMKKLCYQANIPMPAYDRRAYAAYWAVAKA